MRRNILCFAFAVLLLAVLPGGCLLAEDLNFDFGLSLFGLDEIRFENTKTPDFNLRLMKKYIAEHKDSPIQQLHCVVRWFNLLKMSDAPKRKALNELSTEYFLAADVKKASQSDLVNRVFFQGLAIAFEHEKETGNKRNVEYEELLFELEEPMAENCFYWLVKGIVFYHLKHEQIPYFMPMKPEEDLKRAVALIPKEPVYYYALGQAFRLLNSTDVPLFLAIACYEKASALAPQNPRLQNALLGIYMGLHEEYQDKGKPEPFWFEEAVYKKILGISPRNPHALNNLGYLYAEYGVNLETALELCQKAVDANPENPIFRDSLGWAAFKNNDFKKAEEELKKSLQMRPRVYEPHYHLATVYYAGKQYKEAAAHYEEAVNLKPDSAEALNNIAYLYAEQNIKLDSALSYAQKAVGFDSGNGSYLDTLGWVYYRLNKLDLAMNYLKKANEASVGQGEILMHIGRVYLEQGDFESAISYLKEAYKLDNSLNDYNESLYLAVCLKAYRGALADYHGLLGKNAEPNKIIGILLSLARLYQDNSLYYKAIEINRLCADIKNGKIPLDKPIFNDYELRKPQKQNPAKKGEAGVTAASSATSTESGNAADGAMQTETGKAADSAKAKNGFSADSCGEAKNVYEKNNGTGLLLNAKQPEANQLLQSQNAADADFVKPESSLGFSLVLSFGPRFFDCTENYISAMRAFKNKSVTFFVRNLAAPTAAVVVKISDSKSSSIITLNLLTNYLLRFFKSSPVKTDNSAAFKLINTELYLLAEGDSVFISNAPLNKELIGGILGVCPYNEAALGEIIYDWQNVAARLPKLIKYILPKSLEQFKATHRKYTLQNGVFCKDLLITVGEARSKALAKRLLYASSVFKARAKKKGLDIDIKITCEGESIRISVNFNNMAQYLKKTAKKYSKAIEIFWFLFGERINKNLCFFNRLMYIPDQQSCCPSGGNIRCYGHTDFITCDKHSDLPASPIFLSPEAACRFNRARLELFLEMHPESLPKNDEELKQLTDSININLCPLKGVWRINNGHIDCTAHP